MERRFSTEAELEILKHEVAQLKEICKDLKKSLEMQKEAKDARKEKTKEPKEMDICLMCGSTH